MRIFLATLLLIGGCGAPSGDADQAAPAKPAAIGSATSAAEAHATVYEQRNAVAAALAENGLGSEGAPPRGAFRWTGRFASSRDLCPRGTWAFTNARVVTSGESVCSISEIGEGGGQVELRLSCSAEGMWSDEKWTLTPREGGGMRVSRSIKGAETSDVELLRCG